MRRRDFIANAIVKFNVKADELIISYKGVNKNKGKNLILMLVEMDEDILDSISKQKSLFIIEHSENQNDNFNYPVKNSEL